jgi:hypothetical protein
MHIVLHENLLWPPPRWLDEGIATNVEEPSDAYRNWVQVAQQQFANGQAKPLRQLNTEDNYSENSYSEGSTLVAMLLEQPGGRQELIAFAKAMRDQGLDRATETVYRMTPEQIDALYARWLPAQKPDSEQRCIGGVWCTFQMGRWIPVTQVGVAVGVNQQTPAPLPAAQPATPGIVGSCQCTAKMAAMQKDLDAIKQQLANPPAGPPGPPGVNGKDGLGLPGPQGPPGNTPQIDTTKFATNDKLGAVTTGLETKLFQWLLYGLLGSTGIGGVAAVLGSKLAVRGVSKVAEDLKAKLGSAGVGGAPVNTFQANRF